jgi:tetratricopeptide (TPR) repeat protein
MLRGIAMRNLGRSELAREHFAMAIESDPTRAEPLLQIAAMELENNRPGLASDWIAKAMELDEELVRSSGWAAYLLSPQPRLASDEPSRSTQR